MKIRGDGSRISCAALILFVLPYIVVAELPSCYRARCSHCTVEFIAKMCPSSCGACGLGSTAQSPKVRPGRPIYNSAVNSNFRAHGTAISNNLPAVSSQSTLQREVYIPTDVEDVNQRIAAPTAQQLPDKAYNTYAPQQQFAQNTNYYTHQQNNLQPQQQYLPQQQPQTTSYGSSYAANFPPVTSGNTAQQFGSYSLQSNQQQPYYIAQSQQSQLYPNQQPQSSQPQQFYAQAQPAAPPPPPPQPFNIFQPQTPFINPFQPFLQQSLQAQQQAPFFQPFTAPPVTPPPMIPPLGGTPPPALENAAGTGQGVGNSGLISSLPPPAPALPNYLSAQTAVQQPAQLPYANQAHRQSQYTYAQNAQQLANNQRPKQIYGPQVQQQTMRQEQLQAYNNLPYQQQQQQQVAPSLAGSIDSPSEYINKNSYGDKSGGQLQTCPKQPNWEPCISKDVANERFRNCCTRLGDGCSQLCSYDQTLATIQIAVLTGRCPLGKVADMMICASGYEDATACCQAYNVFEPGFEHCRPYCNPAAGLPNDGMLAEKYRCLGKLSQIQRCFYVSQKP